MAKKNLDDIIDEKIRKNVKEFVSNHKGEKIDAVLAEFSKQTGIKKIRCINRVQTPIEITSGKIPRYLAPEDYFAAIIWEIPGDKKTYKAQYIRRNEVEKDKKGFNVVKANVIESGKPHPAAKQICVLHKDDYLEFTDDGKMYLCRIVGFSATNQCIYIRPIFSVTDCADWIYSTSEKMIENNSCWIKTKKNTFDVVPQAKQNFLTVNAIFGKLQAHLVTVSPIGKVFRKKS